jgi:hypothetical protein
MVTHLVLEDHEVRFPSPEAYIIPAEGGTVSESGEPCCWYMILVKKQ